jgi:hypothetical protein
MNLIDQLLEKVPVSKKILKLIGAGTVLLMISCSAGVWFWGVNYAKNTSRVVYEKNFQKVQNFIRETELPIMVTSLGTSESGFFSDKVTYLFNYRDRFEFPVQFINSYGFGSVNTRVSIDDKFYSFLGFKESDRNLIRSIFDSMDGSYNGVNDSSEASADFGNGDFEYYGDLYSWRDGKFNAEIELFSKETKLYKLNFSFSKIFFGNSSGDDGFLLNDFRGNTYISPTEIRNGLFLAKLIEKEGKKVIGNVSNYSSQLHISASENLKGNYYDGSFQIAFEHLNYQTSDYDYLVKNFDFLFTVKDLDLTDYMANCSERNQSMRNMIGCVSLDSHEIYGIPSGGILNRSSGKMSLKFIYKDAEVGLRCSFAVHSDKDSKMNTLSSLADHMTINGSFTLDGRLLTYPELYGASYADTIRSYAMDPNAQILEYRFVFEKGKLSINGKNVN